MLPDRHGGHTAGQADCPHRVIRWWPDGQHLQARCDTCSWVTLVAGGRTTGDLIRATLQQGRPA